MNITDLRVKKINSDGKLKAVVSITLDNMLAVHDIKIIDGNDGLFLAMPSRKIGESNYRDIVHPISQEARKKLEDIVFEAYEKHEDNEETTPDA